MTTTLSKPTRNIISITVTGALIFLAGMLMLHVVPTAVKDKVADGFLADLLITFPVFFYLIIIRPLKISPRKLMLVISVCCGVAYLVLPQHQRDYILQLRKLTAVAELAFIIYALTKLNKLNSAYKIHSAVFADPIYNLRSAMADVMGDSFAVKIISSELAMLRYGLLFWKKDRSGLQYGKAFSTHREFGYIAVWCILIFAMMVEMVAFHLLLRKWSNAAAITLTLLSLYTLILFIADLSAILKRKVLVNDDQLILRTGLRWRTITTISNISSVEKISYDYSSTEPYFKGGITKNGGNMLISFKEPVTIDKLYGASKQSHTILMHLDNVEFFKKLITTT